jgi:ribosomal protein S18 acetylase RimI-like enzyme
MKKKTAGGGRTIRRPISKDVALRALFCSVSLTNKVPRYGRLFFSFSFLSSHDHFFIKPWPLQERTDGLVRVVTSTTLAWCQYYILGMSHHLSQLKNISEYSKSII